MWRVAHLPGILRVESDAPEQGKAGFRAYGQALERLLETHRRSTVPARGRTGPSISAETGPVRGRPSAEAGAMTRTEEFLTALDEGMLQCFRGIADELVGRFGMSRAEAVARINAAYEGADIAPHPDLMCHEGPDCWAYGLSFRPKEGRVPHSGSTEDLSQWGMRPAPPKSSHAWTLTE